MPNIKCLKFAFEGWQSHPDYRYYKWALTRQTQEPMASAIQNTFHVIMSALRKVKIHSVFELPTSCNSWYLETLNPITSPRIIRPPSQLGVVIDFGPEVSNTVEERQVNLQQQLSNISANDFDANSESHVYTPTIITSTNGITVTSVWEDPKLVDNFISGFEYR
jgi:hypothetical protein